MSLPRQQFVATTDSHRETTAPQRVRVVADVGKLSGTKIPLQNAGHIDVEKGTRDAVRKELNCISDILANAGECFDFLAGRGEPAVSLDQGCCETFETGGSLLGEA